MGDIYCCAVSVLRINSNSLAEDYELYGDFDRLLEREAA